ncbi:MAG: FAD-binding oxidoreductase [Sedimenticola sp.]|nr:FAD-binding oxidoreductase [Sedimenticola sp.]
MKMSGWGRYPQIETEVVYPASFSDCSQRIRSADRVIARGLGRSYGDSSLYQNMLGSRYLDRYVAFDEESGLLTCSAGVSLDQIVSTFVPRGWFLPVTPGTRFVTIGGAIASDVHGKNHHVDGTFCDHVDRIDLLLGSGEVVTVTPDEKPDLFRATCGGMGLTGMILSASLKLRRIKSGEMEQTIIKTPDIEATLRAFEEASGASYSVAWIDCLARGKALGRSLLVLGEHAQKGSLNAKPGQGISIPCNMPSGLLNPLTVKLFNALYYNKVLHSGKKSIVSLHSFFYPLDSLQNWNRLYGRKGFVQYQFVLPKSSGLEGIKHMLERISHSGRGSFLAVLKVFGSANDNLLSFPMEGYTLALDFKVEPAVFSLLDELDRIMLDHGGRLYLTKDSRMSEETFKAGYPAWADFNEIRTRYQAIDKFVSGQSIRLGLNS